MQKNSSEPQSTNPPPPSTPPSKTPPPPSPELDKRRTGSPVRDSTTPANDPSTPADPDPIPAVVTSGFAAIEDKLAVSATNPPHEPEVGGGKAEATPTEPALLKIARTLGAGSQEFIDTIPAIERAIQAFTDFDVGRHSANLLSLALGCLHRPDLIGIDFDELGKKTKARFSDENPARAHNRERTGCIFTEDELMHLANVARSIPFSASPDLAAIAILRYDMANVYRYVNQFRYSELA
jgi:hypothetical protein